jgi:hypothetical protein
MLGFHQHFGYRKEEGMKSFEEITKEDFTKYERVRKGGQFNMIMQMADASFAADLDRETYLAICRNYAALMEKFPDARK